MEREKLRALKKEEEKAKKLKREEEMKKILAEEYPESVMSRGLFSSRRNSNRSNGNMTGGSPGSFFNRKDKRMMKKVSLFKNPNGPMNLNFDSEYNMSKDMSSTQSNG